MVQAVCFKGVGEMTDRKALSKKLRFEIFKRDSFTCQYCGRSAPEIVLEIDHIRPISKDGEEEITNLITSCFDCNRGKSDRELSDDTVIAKRKSQLDELQTRREQIEMMLDWQNTLVDISGQELSAAVEFINSFILGHCLNEVGVERVRKSIKRYGLAEVLESARISASQYLTNDGKSESIEKYIDFIHRIASSRRKVAEKPYLTDLYRLKNLMKYQRFFVKDYEAMNLLEGAYLRGNEIWELEAIIKLSRNWSEWRAEMERLTNGK